MKLHDRCIYAAFGEAVQSHCQFRTTRSLKACTEAWTDAKTQGVRIGILFADAANNSSLLTSWALVRSIVKNGGGTVVRFDQPVAMKPIRVNKVRKASDDTPISKSIRRGIFLCHTPLFLERLVLRTTSRKRSRKL